MYPETFTVKPPYEILILHATSLRHGTICRAQFFKIFFFYMFINNGPGLNMAKFGADLQTFVPPAAFQFFPDGFRAGGRYWADAAAGLCSAAS